LLKNTTSELARLVFHTIPLMLNNTQGSCEYKLFKSFGLLCLNQMLHALCLSYHSNAEAALFARLLSGWATTTGRLLGPKMGNSIKGLSQRHSNALLHQLRF